MKTKTRLLRRGTLTTVLALLGLPSAIAGCGSELVDGQEFSEEEGSTATVSSALTSQVIFADEFNDGSLDRSKWVVSDGGINPGANSGSCFNNESASYKDREGCGTGDRTLCEYNGFLHLIARYAPNASSQCGYNQNYVSARMTTKTKFSVNPFLGENGVRIEARVNFPKNTGGVFPAVWLLGDDVKQWPGTGNNADGANFWPETGEIDVAEYGSAWANGSQVLGTLHYGLGTYSSSDGDQHQQIGSYYGPQTTSNSWHNYAVEWSSNEIKWFFDGAQYGSTVNLAALSGNQDFDHGFSIILNNAVGGPGGNWEGIDPALVPQSTSSSSGYSSEQRMAVDWVRVSLINDDNIWQKRVFQGQESNAAFPTDWNYGYYKADCGANAAVTGLSTNTGSITPHAVICTNYGSNLSGNYHETLQDIAAGDHVRPSPSRAGDWDNGYYKSECHNGQYVSGVSQTTSGQIRGLRCAMGALTNSGRNNCETRLVSGPSTDDGNDSTGDWDQGYYKGECWGGKIVYGVSVDVGSKKPHRILCCDK
jgi:beta-glucanase (GH16 family)